MINKKLVGVTLVGLMTVGFAGQVFADQVIDGREGKTEADIKVTGNLGDIDNTDPGEVIPDGDDKWINVQVPTAAVFGTIDKTNITSVPYVMTNHSARPVDVSVQEYKINGGEGVAALESLSLVKPFDNKSVNIAANGESLIQKPGDSVLFDRIDGVGGETTFKFGGTIDSSKLPEKGQAMVDSKLVLKFKSVKIKE